MDFPPSKMISLFLVMALVAGSALSGTYLNKAHNHKCGLPNIVRGQHLEPTKMMGTLYKYLTMQPASLPARVSTFIDMESLGTTTLPGTTIEAVAVASKIVGYNPDKPGCRTYYSVYYFTVIGKQIGISWDSLSNSIPAPDVVTVLHDDYEWCKIVSICGKPGASGTCDLPIFFVDTHIPPPQLTPDLVAYIDRTVNRVLSPYCFSRSDFTKDAWPHATRCQATPLKGWTDLVQGVKASIS